MPKPLSSWPGLRAEVACLHRLAHDRLGISDEQLVAQQAALLSHPALAVRLASGVAPVAALREAVEAVARIGGRGQGLTRIQLDAVKILIGCGALQPSKRHIPDQIARRRRACDLLNEPVDTFSRGRLHLDGSKRSPETDLLTLFVTALDDVNPAASSSGDYVKSPLPSDEADGVYDDLVGTWKGTTTSLWLLKDRSEELEGRHPTFMTVASVGSRSVTIDWWYRDGQSWAVSTRLAPHQEGRRLLCIYEADVTFASRLESPWHRGACLLDIKGSPAVQMEGPYWTDRRTHGVLSFDLHLPRLAHSFEEARLLFS